MRRTTRSWTSSRRAKAELLMDRSRMARNRASLGASQSGTGIRRWRRFGGEGLGIDSFRESRIERSEPSASMASSMASGMSLPSVATRGMSTNSTSTRPAESLENLAGYAHADMSAILSQFTEIYLTMVTALIALLLIHNVDQR